MEDELAYQLYGKKAISLPLATEYQLWQIWLECKKVAAIPFGDAPPDPSADIPDAPHAVMAPVQP